MGHEKQEELEIMLSTYLDGELAPEQASKFEMELEGNPELQERLHQMSELGAQLKGHLNQKAEEQDFSAMRARVMSEVTSHQSAQDMNVQDSWFERSLESLRQLFQQPVMSFALGASVVLGAWFILQSVPAANDPMSLATGDRVSAELPLRTQNVPLEEGANEESPDVILDEIQATSGTLEVRTRIDDPGAPTVLWFVADGDAR